jgi:transposase-like protein
MSETTVVKPVAERLASPVVTRDELDEQLAKQLVAHARAQGRSLVGPDGLLGKLTKLVFETGLEAEMSEHLGYEPHEAAGRGSGNSRNGSRSKTVITEVGPVELEVPRDRNASFEPQLVRKRQRRLTGVDDMVCSLVAKPQSADSIVW